MKADVIDREAKQVERERANRIARFVAAAVAVAGLAVMVQAMVANPRSTKTVVTTDANGITTRQSTKNEALAERVLGPGGLLLLRLGLVAVAASLAGALTQRMYLGRFGLKLGPIDMADAAEITADSTETMEELLTMQVAIQEAMAIVDAAMGELQVTVERLEQAAVEQGAALDALTAQIGKIERGRRVPKPDRGYTPPHG